MHFSKRVVCDEPVVGVEGDEKGGEAGYREDVEDPRVLDNKTGSLLIKTNFSLALPSMVEESLREEEISKLVFDSYCQRWRVAVSSYS